MLVQRELLRSQLLEMRYPKLLNLHYATESVFASKLLFQLLPQDDKDNLWQTSEATCFKSNQCFLMSLLPETRV